MNRQLLFICALVLIVAPLDITGIPKGVEFILYELIGFTLLYYALRKSKHQ